MPAPRQAAARAEALRAEIERHNHAYYVLDAPTVPDAERSAERAIPYVARILQQHLADDPSSRCWTSQA